MTSADGVGKVSRKRYEEVAEALLAEIRSGRLAVGSTLPGELELVGQFGVSRHTIREALRRLEDLGLIGRHQGVGTVVRSRHSTESYVQAVRTPAEMLQYPEHSRLVVVGTDQVRASRALARLLDCPVGMNWAVIRCVRRLKGTRVPMCWSDVYVLPEYAGIAEVIGRRRGPVYELISRRFGETIESVDIDIIARTVPEGIAEALGVEPGSPSLTVVRRYRGEGRRLFEVSVSEHPGDRYTYSLQLRRGWQSGNAGSWVTG